MSVAAVVASLVYMDRFVVATGIAITAKTAHLIALVASMVAAKYCDDDALNTEQWGETRWKQCTRSTFDMFPCARSGRGWT
jgi:hypothetical protein